MSSQRGLPSTRPVHPCVLSVFDGNYGAEYAIWAHITSKELPNLVTAQGSTLRIYTLATGGKLELTESFPHLSGTVCYLESLSSPEDDAFDCLLLGFAGHPRLAICSLQPPTTSRARLLLATSLLDLTPALMDASLGSVTPLEQDMVACTLDRGRDKTVCVVLGGGVAVAAIHLHRQQEQWHASEPFLLPLASFVGSGGAQGAASVTTAYQQTIAHGFGDIWSCCFLDGYLEPTLCLLHSNPQFGRTWSGRLGREGGGDNTRYGCHVTAVSVTVPHHQAAVLWSVMVPADARSVQSTGTEGCLVVSVNSILQVTNAGRSTPALAMNGWARAPCPANVELQPNPWPLPKLAVSLDGAQVAMISASIGLVVLRHGAVYLLQRLEETWSMWPAGKSLGGIGEVSCLLVKPYDASSVLDDKLMPKKSANMTMGLVFCGSHMGDSSLLGYTLESGVTLLDAMKAGEEGTEGDTVVKQEPQEEEEEQVAEDTYEVILQREEEALYALDDEDDASNNATAAAKKGPDVIPPSDEESEEGTTTTTTATKNDQKRAKLVRVSVMRSMNALDSLTAVGPLGPGCEGPLATTKIESKSDMTVTKSTTRVGGTAKIMPCGHGSSGGLALVTAPGRDDRNILVEEDCINVQSIFCLGNQGLVLMGMLPRNNPEDDEIGITALRIKGSGGSVELNQVDIKAWCKVNVDAMEVDTAGDPAFVFHKTQLLAAAELGSNNFGVIVRLMNEEHSYALVTYKDDDDGRLETVANQTLSTGFPSMLLQVSPFLANEEGSTVFGCVWSLGCAIIYTVDSEGYAKEEYIDGHASVVETDDDDEQVFYVCDRITAVDVFSAPSNLFDQPSSTKDATNTNGVHPMGPLDEEDRELYETSDTKASSSNSKETDAESQSLLAPNVVFVAVTRQNGQLQIFKANTLSAPVWEAMGCGQGAMKLDPSDEERPRTPRMHKVYAREMRFFVAGPSEGLEQDYFCAVSTNLGDVQLYKIKDGQLVRVPLLLPSRPSKKQSEHFGKLRRRKILPPKTADDSIVNAKQFYHNQLFRFAGVSNQSGLFAATARPMWYVTERRSLVALSHRSRHVAPGGGKARPVCGFCPNVIKSGKTNTGFMTLHERIGRVGSQRLTVVKGISNFFSPLGFMPGGGYCLEKIPMGVTVHRVQFIDDADVSTGDHPLYAVLISREMEIDQSSLNDDGLSPEERQRIKDEKEEANTKRQVEADLGGFDMEQEWVEEIERENCFDVDTSLGGAPPIRKSAYSVWIVDASNQWNVVDSHELGEFEHGMTMKVMYLSEINVEPGSNSSMGSDDVGTDKLFIAVGSAIVDGDGEDVSAKGRVYLFKVERADAPSLAAGAPVAELSVAFEKDIFHGPVTTLSCLTSDGKSRLVIGAGADVNVEQWGMNRLTQVGFFRATMQVLDIMLFKNFFILSDAYDSMYFLVWRESDKSLTLLAKDYEPVPVYAAGLMSRGAHMTFVCHDDRQNLQFFQYAPGDAAARGGNKLVARSDVHLGSQTVCLESHYCRSSILVNSATPASTLAALKSQDTLFGRSDDDQRLGVHFGTSDGGFGTVLPLNDPDYWRLAALQSVLANAMESDCALNPRAWRLYRRTPRRGGCRNNDRRKSVIDGDLVMQYCDLPTADQEDLASAIGSTVELIMDNLLELRCSGMVI